jgi:hypothetical protein
MPLIGWIERCPSRPIISHSLNEWIAKLHALQQLNEQIMSQPARKHRQTGVASNAKAT